MKDSDRMTWTICSRYDRFWLLGLLVLLIGGVCGLMAAAAFGDNEKECNRYSSNHLVILQPRTDDPTGCDWLVDKFLFNSSGFELNQHSTIGYCNFGCEIWVLTK